MRDVFLEGLGGKRCLRETWAQLAGWRWSKCHPCIVHRQPSGHSWVSPLSTTRCNHTKFLSLPGCIFPTLCCWSWFTLYTVTVYQGEKMKVHLCGLGIPLSRGDTCFLPRQATTRVSTFLKQENIICNGLVISALIWEVGVSSSSPCFTSDKELEPLFSGDKCQTQSSLTRLRNSFPLFHEWCPNLIMIPTTHLRKFLKRLNWSISFNHFMLKDFETSLVDLKCRANPKQAKKVHRAWWLQHTLKVQAAPARVLVSRFFKMPSGWLAHQQQTGRFFLEKHDEHIWKPSLTRARSWPAELPV